MSLTLLQVDSFSFDERAKYNTFPISGKKGIECIIDCVKYKFQRQFEPKQHLYFVKGRTGSGKSTCMPSKLFEYFDNHKDLISVSKRSNRFIVNVVEPTVILAQTLSYSNIEHNPYLKYGINTGYKTGKGNINASSPSKLMYMTTEIFRRMLIKGNDLGNIVIIDECHKLDIAMISLLKEIKEYIFNPNVTDYLLLPRFIFASATIDVQRMIEYYFNHDERTIFDIYSDGYMISYIKGEQNYPTEERNISKEQEEDFKHNNSNFVKWLLTDCIEESIKSKYTVKQDDVLIPAKDILIFCHSVVSFYKLFNDSVLKCCKYPTYKSVLDKKDEESVIAWRDKHRNETRILLLPFTARAKGYSSKLLNYAYDNDVEAQQYEIKIFISTNVLETGKTFNTWYQVFDTGLRLVKAINPLINDINTVSLIKTKIDKSASIQRMGRVGRRTNGIRWKLFTEKSYELLPENILPENNTMASLAFTIVTSKKISDLCIDTVKSNNYLYQNSFDTNLITARDLTLAGFTTPWGEFIKDVRDADESVSKWILEAEYIYYTTKANLLDILILCRYSRTNMTDYAVNSKFRMEYFGKELNIFDVERNNTILEARQEYIKYLTGTCGIFMKLK